MRQGKPGRKINMIDSTLTPKIYQDDPDIGQRRDNGWKTLYGYLNESKRLARCILRNGKITPYEATISFQADITPEDHIPLWKAIARTLRSKRVEGLWVRE